MKKAIHCVATLTVICLVVSVLLAFANYITAPIIRQKQDEAANAALLVVMPEGKDFVLLTEDDLASYTLPATVTKVYREAGGGYVFELTTSGYASGLVLLCGVGADGAVTGATVLSSQETLGAENSYGDRLVGRRAEDIEQVDTVTSATKTTAAYRNAVRDALLAFAVLGGADVDLRSEAEILAESLNTALPSGEGAFEKWFVIEALTGVDDVYVAENGTGYVCVIGDEYVGVKADGTVTSQTDTETAQTAAAAVATVKGAVLTELSLGSYEGLPASVQAAAVTESGSVVLTVRGAGYGILGGSSYHPASGEYIIVRVAISAEGTILDCVTLSQAESENIGDACADEAFYGQFDGKTAQNYAEVDGISGATYTTDGYKKAIGDAFAAFNVLKGGV